MFLVEFAFACECQIKTLTSGKPLPVETLAVEIPTIALASGNLVGVRLIAETRVPLSRVAHATTKLAELLAASDTFPHVETRNTAIAFVPTTPLPETAIIPNPTPRMAPLA